MRIHFGGKNGLWAACVEAVVAEAAPMMALARHLAADDDTPVAMRLKTLIERFVAFSLAHPEVRQFVHRHTLERGERAALLAARLVRPGYEAALPLFIAGMEQGIIRVGHPALFFVLLNNALHQPTAAPLLLRDLMPAMTEERAEMLLSQSIVATFLHDAFDVGRG